MIAGTLMMAVTAKLMTRPVRAVLSIPSLARMRSVMGCMSAVMPVCSVSHEDATIETTRTMARTLDERLDLGALGGLGFGSGLSDLARVAFDTSNHGVGELAVTRPIVEGLDHDGLLASVAASQHDHNLAVLNNSHC